MITTREEYDALLKRGIDCLYDKRYHLEIGLRREIQRERFGKNDAEGNAKFYAYCLKNLPLVCEHCGRPIRLPSAYNVSHIISRGSDARMSHDPRNVNILCVDCHFMFEHTTTRSRMNPLFVEKNERRKELLKKEYNEKTETMDCREDA